MHIVKLTLNPCGDTRIIIHSLHFNINKGRMTFILLPSLSSKIQRPIHKVSSVSQSGLNYIDIAAKD